MKYLSLLCVIFLLFSVTSCGISTNNGHQSGVCSHVWQSATCTEPKTCTKCDETKGSALGHTTDSGICSRCGKNFSAWEIGEYVDEFDRPTGKKYIIVDAVGTFSNSATTNSKLNAALQIDKDNIGIMLWEYGSYLVKGIYDSENYSITVLNENGTKHYFTGTIYEGGTRIYFDDDDRNKVVDLLRSNDILQIYIKYTKYSTSTYLFSVNSAGFYQAYNSIV